MGHWERFRNREKQEKLNLFLLVRYFCIFLFSILLKAYYHILQRKFVVLKCIGCPKNDLCVCARNFFYTFSHLKRRFVFFYKIGVLNEKRCKVYFQFIFKVYMVDCRQKSWIRGFDLFFASLCSFFSPHSYCR